MVFFIKFVEIAFCLDCVFVPTGIWLTYDISMVLCRTAVSALLTHWKYCSFALSHWYVLTILKTIRKNGSHMDCNIADCHHQRYVPSLVQVIIGFLICITPVCNTQLNVMWMHVKGFWWLSINKLSFWIIFYSGLGCFSGFLKLPYSMSHSELVKFLGLCEK